MAISRTLVFDKVKIAGVDYSPFLAQRVSLSATPVNQIVRNNQTLASSWDVEFSVDFLESAVSTLTEVWSNSGAPFLSYIEFVDTADAIRVKEIAGLSNPSITGNISTIDITPTSDLFLPINTRIFVDGESFITSSNLQLDSSLQQQVIDVQSKQVSATLTGDVTAELGLLINNVVLNVIPNFEGERVAFTIKGKKRVVNLFLTVQEANG
jgi:hypothetical protein